MAKKPLGIDFRKVYELNFTVTKVKQDIIDFYIREGKKPTNIIVSKEQFKYLCLLSDDLIIKKVFGIPVIFK